MCAVCFQITSNSTYCSLSCSNRARTIVSFQRNKRLKQNCSHCGYSFTKQGQRHTYCSRSCAATVNGTLFPKRIKAVKPVVVSVVQQWLEGKHPGTSGSDHTLVLPVKRFVKESANFACSECGWGKVHPVTGKVPVHIDHIDGDYTNNSPSNLRVLCPNCHSLTPTYGSLNRGKGRAYKKAYYNRV